VGYAVTAGVLASVVPYAADLTALRFVPPRFFGVFMSVHPVLAALVGTGVLDQFLLLHEWIGIVVVVLTNAVAVTVSRPAAAGTTTPVDASVSGGTVPVAASAV
jgi:inner membrane transporter RhtA